MPAHFDRAPRAARTASRTSLRDARATFWPSASYVRPDSERGNSPPTNSLYVFLTARRSRRAGFRSATDHLRAVVTEIQIRLQAVAAALAAEARLLVTAERRRGIEAVVRVRPDHAGLQPFRHPEN